MTKSGNQMALALLAHVTGAHPSSWMASARTTNPSNDVDYFADMAALAEAGRFDLFFLADTPAARTENLDAWSRYPMYMNILEPVTLLTALAGRTRHIGLGGTASTSFHEPYNLARLFGSLDHISKGRAAWNVVTSSNDYAARNFGLHAMPPHARRYDRAREFVDVVKALWDTYDDDAIVFDRENGVYFDPARFHPLDHDGEFIKLHGALNLARSPQGRPVIIQAGSSEAGKELAAETAEVVFTSHETLAAAQAFYRDLKGRMAKFGRTPDQLKILAGLSPTVAESKAAAEARHQALQDMIHPTVGYQRIGMDLEADLSDLDPDQPIPLDRIPKSANLSTVYFEQIVRLIRDERLTPRQLWQRYERGNAPARGTATEIADRMEEWFTQGACDGFMLTFPVLPAGLADFVAEVVPALQGRGLLRREYEGETLRDHLGLNRPASRYAAPAVRPAGVAR
ncbi:LLM class flavin-dependent oxidoreductase [Zavarzinia compransoris]|uniref:LLM class flavin-dependent oxidoreductase n=1 Tax=Zavarzinia marina TaxID=2911065 RepID=UPI001F42CE40|nr:LLM class flavin-dependent oxidoreductase [Zavarzinia marina]MCF4167321.1 LLM class flavin-dependent oxidoreductase [Zavarzinia marina]